MTTLQVDEAPSGSDASPPAMIDRVAMLLEVFVGQGPLTLAQVAGRAHLPRSSTHRILQRLVELGWVERHGFEYALGLRMFEFGSQVTRQRRVDAALPVMLEVQHRTGLTTHLSVLDGSEILHLARVGLWPRFGQGWTVGARQPVEQAAAGLALLAAMDPMNWPELTFATAATCYSVRSRGQLDREVQRARDRGGIAIDAQGCALGITAISAPINMEHGPMAMSVCGPSNSLNVDAAVATVRNAAIDIWHSTSGAPRPRQRTTKTRQNFAQTP